MTDGWERVHAVISTAAIAENYRAVRAVVAPSCRVLAVVKADAYGHGAVPVARALAAAGADWFGTATLEEAAVLREAGLTQPILVLSYTPPSAAAALCRLQITQSVADKAYAEALSKEAVKAGVTVDVHIKLDTGMSRLGFVYHSEADDEALNEIAVACRLPGLHAEGLFTHFATADEPDDTATRRQFALFQTATEKLKQRDVHFSLRHCCNSAATLRFPEMQLDMVRPGIVLYGYSPDAGLDLPVHLTPAMELRAMVAQVKTVPAGTAVSYGATAVTEKETTLATVELGYADGLPRACGNRACLLAAGSCAPLVGRVCMDQCLLNVSGLSVQAGDEVTVFGADLPADRLAAAADTIPYEILCRVGKRVPRVYAGN